MRDVRVAGSSNSASVTISGVEDEASRLGVGISCFGGVEVSLVAALGCGGGGRLGFALRGGRTGRGGGTGEASGSLMPAASECELGLRARA